VHKGEVDPGEDRLIVAWREFAEETEHELPDGPMIELGDIRQKSGKRVLAWAVQGILERTRERSAQQSAVMVRSVGTNRQPSAEDGLAK
jgi:predicted NUDIX family NTP pyrophosphohydrolase